jgi:hypothetical protein
LSANLEQGLEYQAMGSIRAHYTGEIEEGLRAFSEKRLPRFGKK